jgi:hypothetical protein
MSDAENEKRRATDNDRLAQLTPEDFGGRTAFRCLTPEQKLRWLAHAASFAMEARRVRATRSGK